MLTEEEEQILRLMVAECKAKQKLLIEREKFIVINTPLQEAAKVAQQALKEVCK